MLLTCPGCSNLYSESDTARSTVCPKCKGKFNVSESGSMTPDKFVNISEVAGYGDDQEFVNISE